MGGIESWRLSEFKPLRLTDSNDSKSFPGQRIPAQHQSTHGVGFVIGAAFASGILGAGAVPGARYRYADATPEILVPARRLTSGLWR
jgi:hypothetical protein